MSRTRRYGLVLGFFLAAAPLAKTATAVPPELVEYVEGCPEEDPHGICPPTCGCSCHASRRVEVESVGRVSLPPVAVRGQPGNQEAPVSPEPRPIRHVPKYVV